MVNKLKTTINGDYLAKSLMTTLSTLKVHKDTAQTWHE